MNCFKCGALTDSTVNGMCLWCATEQAKKDEMDKTPIQRLAQQLHNFVISNQYEEISLVAMDIRNQITHGDIQTPTQLKNHLCARLRRTGADLSRAEQDTIGTICRRIDYYIRIYNTLFTEGEYNDA